ncbi:MAG TPA: hypothetical protein VHO25_14265 [Polyangiaceae bacterium]|nr:hypothetical protein [Polyangiaceae bacterium]
MTSNAEVAAAIDEDRVNLRDPRVRASITHDCPSRHFVLSPDARN